MEAIKILSIDFDYFIDTDIKTRNDKFPNGLDEAPEEFCKQMWNDAYENFPEIKTIGVHKHYYAVCHYLRHPKYKLGKNVFIADSHKEIKNLIDTIPMNTPINMINIDFHHDYYHYFSGGNEYNCGNWARKLQEERPNARYLWIRRKDSDTRTIVGEVPCRHNTKLVSTLSYFDADYVFICNSPEWTPPHLLKHYLDMIQYTY